MKASWKRLTAHLLLPLAVGGAAALLTRNGMGTFRQLALPPLTPPGWVFPVVWTALYLLMGAAAFLALGPQAPQGRVRRGWGLYGAQLAANFLWPLLFFRWGLLWAALAWLGALWLLVLATLAAFWRLDRRAGQLLLPYLAWVTFAGYLNLGVALGN